MSEKVTSYSTRLITNRDSICFLLAGVIYSTNCFHSQNPNPRFDFVVVNTDNTENPSLAQVLAFVEITGVVRRGITVEDKNPPIILAIVRYLTIDEAYKNVSNILKIFDIYKWETIDNGYNIDIIEFASVIGPAYVVPVWSKHSTLVTERFYYVPRRFSDRSGWEHNITKDMHGRGLFLNRDEIQAYINKAQTEKRLAVNNAGMLMLDQNNNNIDDDDENEELEGDWNMEVADEGGDEVFETDEGRLSTMLNKRSRGSSSDLDAWLH